MTNNNTAPHMDATGADNDPSFEQITPHVTREWLYGRRILVFRVTSFEDAEVDAWAKVYIEALTAWPPDRPFLAVQDISYRLFALTPRTRARIAEVYRLGRDTEGRVAVIVPNTLVARFVRFFLSTLQRVTASIRFFTSREAGLAWLKECLDSELPQGGSAADEAQTDQG
jgi:hypothetical protein